MKCSWDFLSGLCFNHLIKAPFVGLYLCWRCFKKPDPIHTVKLGCDGADYPEAQILWRKVNWNVWPEADWTVLCFRRCAHGRLWNGQPGFFWCCQTRHASPDPGWQQRHPRVQPGWGGLCCHPPLHGPTPHFKPDALHNPLPTKPHPLQPLLLQLVQTTRLIVLHAQHHSWKTKRKGCLGKWNGCVAYICFTGFSCRLQGEGGGRGGGRGLAAENKIGGLCSWKQLEMHTVQTWRLCGQFLQHL